MYKHLPKHAKAAEIGVHYGKNAKNLLEITDPKELVLIDVWAGSEINPEYYDPFSKEKHEEIYQSLVAELKGKPVRIIRKDRLEALSEFPDNYFNWVYIDAEHTYEAVYAELQAVRPKLAKNGIILGHDFSETFEGLQDAVHQFMKEHNWRIVALTEDKSPSFWLQN